MLLSDGFELNGPSRLVSGYVTESGSPTPKDLPVFKFEVRDLRSSHHPPTRFGYAGREVALPHIKIQLLPRPVPEFGIVKHAFQMPA